jgi:hypothetical protein
MSGDDFLEQAFFAEEDQAANEYIPDELEDIAADLAVQDYKEGYTDEHGTYAEPDVVEPF